MLSINTNLSSLLAQNSMKSSTNKLNQAIERMTTGFKINQAKDNAANYSISNNMTTQIGAYEVAEENATMGLDMVTTACDTLSQMQSHATRLRALATQARNGTYGSQSLDAIQAEAVAITEEIERLYNTAEYNGISLFNKQKYTIAPHLPQAGSSGFIDETALSGTGPPTVKYNGFVENPVTYDEKYVDELKSVSEVKPDDGFTENEYKIASVNDLVKLAELANAGVSTSGKTFILAKDIDLGAYCDANMATGGWIPIGTYTNPFNGTFDGNGHKIKNLKINRMEEHQGLFGYVHKSYILNIGIINCNVVGDYRTGSLVGISSAYSVGNCFATGKVIGNGDTGGLIGCNNSNVTNCYTDLDVISTSNCTGGLVGWGNTHTISNCFALGNVSSSAINTGGLIGFTQGSVNNCYALGDVKGVDYTGGLVGKGSSVINNSFARGNVIGRSNIGGFVGILSGGAITNSYAIGDVIGQGSRVGGLIGDSTVSTITNSFAKGCVTGQGNYIGGLIGINYNNSIITNSYAVGNVTGQGFSVGGLAGESSTNSTITNCYALGDVAGQNNYVGGLIGANSENSIVAESYAIGNVTGMKNYVGGLIGFINSPNSNAEISNCASYSRVHSTSLRSGSFIGGIYHTSDDVNYGNIVITNCEVVQTDNNVIGVVLKSNLAINSDYDMTAMLAGVSILDPIDISTNLQVGINGENSSQINFDTSFELNLPIINSGLKSDKTLNEIDEFINILSKKSTMLGSISNRLESVLDEILIQHDNLISSRSTLRDADIAEVSSTYIQQQILQQASATLLATANQSPSIALQLI